MNIETRDADSQRRLFWLLLAGCAVLVFLRLGALPLLDVDEPVYGEVGKEMSRSDAAGWLTPHYAGHLWFDKPPLFYWLTALSLRAFGDSEWAARFPSALLSLVLVAATFALTRRAYPQVPLAAPWAAFVLATCAQFFMLARGAVTDMTLVACLTAALLGLYAWLETDRGRWMALAGVMTGLATLTKGPVAIVLLGLQVIVFLVWTRQARRLLSPALWGGFGLCLAVALPWFLAMIHLHGGAFIQGFLEANNVTRYLQAEHRTTQSPVFFVPVFLGLFLPWTVALPGTVRGSLTWYRQERAGQGIRPTLFFLVWFVLVLVFFSASQSKLITYIFPLYPAAAILTGRWLAETPGKAGRWAFAILAVLLVAALESQVHKYGVDGMTAILWLVALGGGAVLSVVLRRGVWLVPGLAFAVMLLIAWCSPTLQRQEGRLSERRTARIASAAVPPGGEIYALALKHPSLVYYAARPVIGLDDRGALLAQMRAHPGTVCILRRKALGVLETQYGFREYKLLGPNELLPGGAREQQEMPVVIQATAAAGGRKP